MLEILGTEEEEFVGFILDFVRRRQSPDILTKELEMVSGKAIGSMHTKAHPMLYFLDIGYRSSGLCDEIMESPYFRDREKITEAVNEAIFITFHNKNTSNFDLIYVFGLYLPRANNKFRH